MLGRARRSETVVADLFTPQEEEEEEEEEQQEEEEDVEDEEEERDDRATYVSTPPARAEATQEAMAF